MIISLNHDVIPHTDLMFRIEPKNPKTYSSWWIPTSFPYRSLETEDKQTQINCHSSVKRFLADISTNDEREIRKHMHENLSDLQQKFRHSSQRSGGFEVVSTLKH